MKVGIIPARFQVPDLHPAHHLLIEQAMKENELVVIVLGVSQTGPTDHNPLDFRTRAQMVKAHYPTVEVAPLKDRSSDFTWSRNLDDLIGTYAKESDEVHVYCGRDGFKSHYHGKNKIKQIEAVAKYSGTSLRKEARLKPIDSTDFRKGIIYGVGAKYPTTFMTVDIAVIRGDSVLMAKRPGSNKYRFPGGFVGFTDHSLEQSCKRELEEEIGLEARSEHDFKYISSIPIDDWRYRDRPDARIMTALFKIDENDTVGDISPDGDELEDFFFLSLEGDALEDIVEEHQELYMELVRHRAGNISGVSNPKPKKKAN